MEEILENWIKNREKLDKFIESVQSLQSFASEHGINDIFLDNGGKLLQILLLTGLKKIPCRHGNDAIDARGNEYEIKSVDHRKKQKGFSTGHHVKASTIERYRTAHWIFAVYSGVNLKEIYLMTPSSLESVFKKWEDRLRNKKKTHLNNPKIPYKFVREHSKLIYKDEKCEAETTF